MKARAAGAQVRGASFRGQPLVLLALVLLGWTGLRVIFGAVSPAPAIVAAAGRAMRQGVAVADAGAPRAKPGQATRQAHVAGAAGHAPPAASVPAMPFVAGPSPGSPADPVTLPLPAPAGVTANPPAAPVVPHRIAAGHNLLLLAGLADMEIPQAVLAHLQQPVVPVSQEHHGLVATRGAVAAPRRRWSADSWVMLRQDSASPLLSGRPAYGRSQAGAVLRYHLDPAATREGQVYVRASRALAGARENEAAAGLSLRPLHAVPLRVAAEMRVAQTDRGTRASPAAYAVTELPPMDIPGALRAETYVQAGYAGGSYATAFVDGQARVDRHIATLAGVELRAGGGAWGGAQRGSARLDAGPTAALTFRIGHMQGRLAADYRFRMAGKAGPSSGPANTLSAGF